MGTQSSTLSSGSSSSSSSILITLHYLATPRLLKNSSSLLRRQTHTHRHMRVTPEITFTVQSNPKPKSVVTCWKLFPHPKPSYLCDSHAESVGEEQASVPFKQRATPQEWQSDEEERRAALLNMQREGGKRRGQTG